MDSVNDTINVQIGQRIFDLRVERDLQQGELAVAVGLNQSVLNRIEKGTRPAKAAEIRMLAQYFGVSSDTILGISVAAAAATAALDEHAPLTSIVPSLSHTPGSGIVVGVASTDSGSDNATETASTQDVRLEERDSSPPPVTNRTIATPTLADTLAFTPLELTLMTSFRALDTRGQETVRSLIAIEQQLMPIFAQ